MDININEVIELLTEARGYVECCCEEDRSDPASEVLAKIDDLLAQISKG